ncbi:hypothetical protein BV20DRAFT_922467, partial [Pilatotrama ljubarskyi]
VACRKIPWQSLVEVSSVLLFSAEAHGKDTVRDLYKFRWRDGCMALASRFVWVHEANVIYMIDSATESIRSVTTRRALPDEELCIFYGQRLWL